MSAHRPDPTTLSAILELHERYVVDVVEALNLCPFSRRARERGEVRRIGWWADDARADLEEVARAFARAASEDDDLAIGLLTFATWGDEDPWLDPRVFDDARRAIHDAYASIDAAPVFHMVSFHPRLDVREGVPSNPQTSIPLLRRTPDPVIQCVRASVLDAIHEEGRERARAERMEQLAEFLADVPEAIREAVRYSEIEDPVSASIGKRNHELVVHERVRLEEPIRELLDARERIERAGSE